MPTGQGDVQNPNAWTGNTPTLGVGSLSAPAPRGDFLAAGYTKPGDPNNATALTSFQVVTPTLGAGSVPAVHGQGDVGDVLGASQNTDTEQGVYALIAWGVGPSSLGLGTVGPVVPKGDLPSKLTWADVTPTLGVGSLTAPHGQGDIMMQSPGGDGLLPVFTWVIAAPSLGLGTIAPVTGKGDVPNPYSWEDSIFFLTSQLYPLLTIEHLTSQGGILDQPQFTTVEHTTPSSNFIAGTLTLNLFIYSNGLAEHTTTASNFTAGTLTLGLITYGNGLAEHTTTASNFTAGTLVFGLITYSNWPAENVTEASNLTAGTLT